VLDAGFVCHLGLLVDGWPMVVPTSYARHDDWLFLHGSVASRSLRAARDPVMACVTVTHIDGLVLARSVFEHAVNYRCAMVYGVPEVLVDTDQKLVGLRAISDQVAPGQWEYARAPTAKELAATTVLRLTLDECSVKVRRGPPDDGHGPDAGLDVWAGEIPLRTVRLDPVPDPALRPGIALPDHLSHGHPAPGSTPLRDGPTGGTGETA
jgi:nitroimidazol reductase NimA-like FMN-containing flavoprotein (pyridoxamine 5'-phosphate oxidase superfamily)